MSVRISMLDLKSLSIVGISAQHADDLERRTRDSLIAEGRAARRARLPRKVPPFSDPDMAITWGMGWRWEDEELRAPR